MKFWHWFQAKFPTREAGRQFLVVGVALALLPLLAALQYHWLGQVSDGEREFTKSKLRVAAENLSQDFDQQLTRLYEAARLELFTPEFLIATATANWPTASPKAEPSPHPFQVEEQAVVWQRLVQWQQSEAATWVKSIALASVRLERQDAQAQVELRCLDVAQGKLVPCGWSAELEPLRAQFELRLNNLQRALAGQEPFMPPRFSEGLLGDVPALVFLLPRSEFGRSVGNRMVRFIQQGNFATPRRRNEAPQTPQLLPFEARFAIVTLKLEYLRAHLLPTLVKTHFGGEAANYDLALVKQRNPADILFATQSGVDYSRPDVTATMFGLRQDLLRNWLRERWIAGASPQSGTAPAVAPRSPTARGERTQAGRTASVGEAVPLPFLMPPPGSDANGQWELRIKHRAGSLAIAVASARRRNLLISLGILLLLTASLALLVSSARRAERLAQAQMDFVAGVSHELRTPISVIDAAGYNLTRGHIKDAEQVARYGALIRQESRRLTDMVEQILEFAGAQTKRPPYDLQPTDLKQVIATTLATPLLTESGFEIEQQLPAELPPIQADAAALQRALQNLLSNALKYSGDSRWVQLQARLAAPEKAVQLTVRDRGLGIPAHELPRIFEPFFRGQEGRAAQIHGNGLGLSLVKNIIEAHGGRVFVASEVGRGSAFTLSLPLAAEQSGNE